MPECVQQSPVKLDSFRSVPGFTRSPPSQQFISFGQPPLLQAREMTPSHPPMQSPGGCENDILSPYNPQNPAFLFPPTLCPSQTYGLDDQEPSPELKLDSSPEVDNHTSQTSIFLTPPPSVQHLSFLQQQVPPTPSFCTTPVIPRLRHFPGVSSCNQEEGSLKKEDSVVPSVSHTYYTEAFSHYDVIGSTN